MLYIHQHDAGCYHDRGGDAPDAEGFTHEDRPDQRGEDDARFAHRGYGAHGGEAQRPQHDAEIAAADQAERGDRRAHV